MYELRRFAEFPPRSDADMRPTDKRDKFFPELGPSVRYRIPGDENYLQVMWWCSLSALGSMQRAGAMTRRWAMPATIHEDQEPTMPPTSIHNCAALQLCLCLWLPPSLLRSPSQVKFKELYPKARFTLRAKNAFGWSPFSRLSPVLSAGDAIRCKEVGGTHIDVEWDCPPGMKINRFEIQRRNYTLILQEEQFKTLTDDIKPTRDGTCIRFRLRDLKPGSKHQVCLFLC